MEWETSEPVDFTEITGEYRAEHPAAVKDVLILKSDSTYMHIFEGADHRQYVDSGTFHMRHGADGARLWLSYFNHHFLLSQSPPGLYPPIASDTTYDGWGAIVFKKTGEPICLKRSIPQEAYYKVK
ncbi:MAG: hypothetical protein JSU65_03150 [Candidatus Zixiibacteriota bacterium]|nr:MAG: hypothetical protein JSU65_03150 [candidate division Zixibacteria bacterium]